MVDVSAPTFHVRCLPDGEGGPAPRFGDLRELVTEFVFEDKEKGADKLALTVQNFELVLTDDPAFKRGMLLEVQFGYPGRMAPARQMVVSKITGAQELKVEAHDKSILMTRRRQTRSFERMRRSDVVRQVAAENGYSTPDAVDVDDTSVVYDSIHQAHTTDAAFLSRLAHLEGFEWYVDWDGFHWHARRLGQRPARELEFYTAPRQGTVISFRVDNDITARPARTRVQGRDLLNRRDVDQTADDATDTGRTALAPVAELVDPETGRATTVDLRAASEEVRPTSAQDDASAAAEARGRFRRVQLTAVKMNVEVVGDPYLFAKSSVLMSGVGTRLSGLYWVKGARHTISGSGYTTALEMMSDGSGGHARSSRVAQGLELLQTPPTAAHVNTDQPEAPAEGEAHTLEPLEVIDPETGRATTTFREGRGRTGS